VSATHPTGCVKETARAIRLSGDKEIHMSIYLGDDRVLWSPDGLTARIPDPGNGEWRIELGEHGSKVYDQHGQFCKDLSFKSIDESIADIIGAPA
jgi:hypothetical protein